MAKWLPLILTLFSYSSLQEAFPLPSVDSRDEQI